MPDWKTHKLIEKILLGKNTNIEKFIDVPPVPVPINEHRKVWGHSEEFLVLTYLIDPTPDKDLFKAHVIHLWLDQNAKYKDTKQLQDLLTLLNKILNR